MEASLSSSRFQISFLTVLALIALRLCLGCHFLYEGVWKIAHRDEFTAEPFLTQAKGPLAPYFYAMVPDMAGRERLRIEQTDKVRRINAEPIIARWNEIRKNMIDVLKPKDATDEKAQTAYKQLQSDAEKVYQESSQSLWRYCEDNVDDIAAYFGSLDRFENDSEKNQDAPFQKERRWMRMTTLRGEANVWLREIEAREQDYLKALRDSLSKEQRAIVDPTAADWRPWMWSQMQLLNFTVTVALTAIGACLILGLCTRLAALGGAAFMCFIVATQPAWPLIYPPASPEIGHALLINKDFIELIALLVISTTAVGRWGGLDFFLHHLFVKPFMSKKFPSEQPQ